MVKLAKYSLKRPNFHVVKPHTGSNNEFLTYWECCANSPQCKSHYHICSYHSFSFAQSVDLGCQKYGLLDSCAAGGTFATSVLQSAVLYAQ